MDEVTTHHLLMALAFHFKARMAKDVALLVARGKKSTGGIFMACDESARYPGHTAVVNLIQQVFETGSWNHLTDPHIYLTCQPSPADLGIFVEQVKQSGRNGDPRLFYPPQPCLAALVESRPTKLVSQCLNPKHVHGVPRALVKGFFPSFFSAWGQLATAKIYSSPPRLELQDGSSFAIEGSQWEAIAEFLADPRALEQSVQCRFGVVGHGIGAAGAPVFTDGGDIGVARSYGALSPSGKAGFDAVFGFAAYGLAAPIGRPMGKSGSRQKVGAVLAGERGEILSWGIDFSATFHAEVTTIKLLQERYTSPQLPANSRLYTSLEPCFMCSGLLNAYGQSEGFVVLYGQEDPAIRQGADTFLKNHLEIQELEGDFPYPSETKSTTFPSRLKEKGEELGKFDPRKYKKSVMQQLEVESSNRRFAKAILGFGRMVDDFATWDDDLDAQVVAQAWLNVLALLTRVHGVSEDALIRKAAEYMTQTRGRNPARQKDESYVLRKRKEGKYEEIADSILKA